MTAAHDSLQTMLDPQRLFETALALVAIPSPTGDSRRVAQFYAELLRGQGLAVEFDEELPESPCVIAYVDGAHPGPTLQLAGHLDVIPVPHERPVIRDGLLYGRGAQDMKGSLAAVAETARVLTAVRDRLHGRLMICAYGYHEAPLGRSQNLSRLLARGVKGDAAIVVEGPHDEVALIQKGMSTFEIVVERPGEPLHEVQAPPDTPHPLLVGLDVAEMLRAWDRELEAGPRFPFVGRESVFIGQFESGDFYNRIPTQCRIVGTRRYAPHTRFATVQAEFEGRLEALRQATPCTIALRLDKTKDGFQVGEDELLVRRLQEAYRSVTGRPLPVGGFRAVADASDLVNDGGIPAVYFGIGMERGHATPEYVPLARLEQLARVLVETAALYLGLDG